MLKVTLTFAISVPSTDLRQCCRYFKHRAWKVCFYMHVTRQGYRLFLNMQDVKNTKTRFAKGLSLFFSHTIIRRCSRKGNEKTRARDGGQEKRWKELSTVLKISVRWTAIVSQRGTFFFFLRRGHVNIPARPPWNNLTKTNNTRYIRRCSPFM